MEGGRGRGWEEGEGWEGEEGKEEEEGEGRDTYLDPEFILF